jgi:tRNA(fMet)-specific endonuclease VapC
MLLLDTDTLTLLNMGHPRIRPRAEKEKDIIAITVISRIEVLMGRFNFVLKAADGEQLLLAQNRLVQSDNDLATLRIIPVDAASCAEFNKLRTDKKLKKIGRPDLLIACVALAHRAKLVTRNLKDFRQVPGLQIENWAD